VTDEKGAPVDGLTAQDVAVLESGAARTLTRVERDERPLRLAVLVDTSEPMGDHYRLHILDPLLRFLGRLPKGTEFAVWTTGDRPNKVVDYGQGTAAAAKALRRIFPTGGNTLLDALVEASRDLQSKEAARSAIVVVTGTGAGFTNYSKEQVVDIVRPIGATVLAAEIEESGVDASRGQGEVSRTDYDYTLGNLADATGGRRDTLLSAMGAGRTLDSFAGELGSQYRITYDSVAGLKDKDRKVEVKVARPGAKVRIGIPRS
jgi:VWFA-related protein